MLVDIQLNVESSALSPAGRMLMRLHSLAVLGLLRGSDRWELCQSTLAMGLYHQHLDIPESILEVELSEEKRQLTGALIEFGLVPQDRAGALLWLVTERLQGIVMEKVRPIVAGRELRNKLYYPLLNSEVHVHGMPGTELGLASIIELAVGYDDVGNYCHGVEVVKEESRIELDIKTESGVALKRINLGMFREFFGCCPRRV